MNVKYIFRTLNVIDKLIKIINFGFFLPKKYVNTNVQKIKQFNETHIQLVQIVLNF